MADMIVSLYNRDDHFFDFESPKGIKIVRAMTLDKNRITNFIEKNFSDICPEWVFEAEATILKPLPSCFIAIENSEVIGFACYNASALGMFGPFGVAEEKRKNGIGGMLLKQCLKAMKYEGYAYGVIGWVSSETYYSKSIGAVTIPDSFPAVYSRLVKIDEIIASE